MTAQILDFPIIPLKLADRGDARDYRCSDCGEMVFSLRTARALYCNCGAEMRPVEGK
ncbi:MAG: hypothetical protein ACR2RF_33125 [Geminicoccaceae bacterium]